MLDFMEIEPQDVTSRVFGPLRPEADDEALVLGCYISESPEVLPILRELDPDDRNLFITYSEIDAMPLWGVQHYATNLVVGYHLRDQDRRDAKALDRVNDELSNIRRYYELVGSLLPLPTLVYRHQRNLKDTDSRETEFVWFLTTSPESIAEERIKAAYSIRNLLAITKAANDPAECEGILYEELKSHRASSQISF